MMRPPQSGQPDPLTGPLLLVFAFVAVLAWPCFVSGYGVKIAMKMVETRVSARKWRGLWLLVGASAVLGGCAFYFLAHPFDLFLGIYDQVLHLRWMALLFALVPLWLASLWLTPASGILLSVFVSQQLERSLLRQVDSDQAKGRAVMQRAIARSKSAPEEVEGNIVLGAAAEGDLPWTRQREWCIFPTEELGKPGVLIGESRSGKTFTLIRLVYLAAKVLKWKIIYIDAKGDEELAHLFTAVMLDAGVPEKQIGAFPFASYDGWRGDATAIYNRLLGIVPQARIASGGAMYYRDMLKLVLSLAIQAGKEPPRDSVTLLERMRFETLESLYAGRLEAAEVKEMSKSDASGARNRYRAFFNSLGSKLDGGWSFDDVRASYILLEGLGLRDEAMSLGRFFVEELAHYASVRKPRAEQVLCIIDDASALELGREVSGLVERLAGYNCYCYLSGQSFESLGPFNREIVGATTTRILHRSSDPEGITSRAGMRKEVSTGYQSSGNRATGMATAQLRDVPNVHPDEVKRLGVGDVVIVAQGRARKAHITPVGATVSAHTAAERVLRELTRSDWTQPAQQQEELQELADEPEGL